MNNMVQVEGMSRGLTEIAEELRKIRETLSVNRDCNSKVSMSRDGLSRLEQAMLVMFRMRNPSLRAISRAMGYKNHNSLYKIDGFRIVWDRYRAMLSFEYGNGRSSISRRESDCLRKDDDE